MNLIPRNFFLEDVFDDFLTSQSTEMFKCDIYEKDNKYYIELDAPGFSKEDLSIEVDKGYLTVSISKREETEEKDKNYIRRERNIKSYKRTFYIGDIDADHVEASFENGAIKIEVPKIEEVNTKKQIEIK